MSINIPRKDLTRSIAARNQYAPPAPLQVAQAIDKMPPDALRALSLQFINSMKGLTFTIDDSKPAIANKEIPQTLPIFPSNTKGTNSYV